MKDFSLAFFHIFHLLHMGVFEHILQSLCLTEHMFGHINQGFGRAGFNAFWLSIAQVTFKRHLNILVSEDCSKRTGNNALLTGNAFFFYDSDNSVLPLNGSSRAVLCTFRFFALMAENRHPNHRRRIYHHYPNPGFFRVNYPEFFDGASELAQLTATAPLRNNRELQVYPPCKISGRF